MSIRQFQQQSAFPLPSVAIPEGSELYQYDTNMILFYDSKKQAWYDRKSQKWYKPGTVMEEVT